MSKSFTTLQELTFIGGSKQYLTYNILHESGLPVDIATSTAEFVMCPLGQPNYEVLKKTAVKSEGTFLVTLNPADTNDFSGKYIQQLIITDKSANIYIPAQGVITIVPKIKGV